MRGISSVAQVVAQWAHLSSRQVAMLYAELGSINPGSMGFTNDHRFTNRIPQGTIPKKAPKQPQFVLKQAGVNRHGGGVYVVQRGIQENEPFRESRRILHNPISCTQKRWGYKTSHQPEETQWINPSPALQNGGHSYCERPAKRERLLTKVDRKDACFMVPIHELDRKYLRFSVREIVTNSVASPSVYHVPLGSLPRPWGQWWQCSEG